MKKITIIKSHHICLSIIMVFLLGLLRVSQAQTQMPDYEILQQITTNLNNPQKIALGPDEYIHVTESGSNKLIVYNPIGGYIRTLFGLDMPVSVAVDMNGRIFIGNRGRGNVEAYDYDDGSGFILKFKLGAGNGEFTDPRAIAIDSAGKIYVADSGQHEIRIYNSDGSHSFSFGSYGEGDGQFNKPISIAIDEVSVPSGEVLVLDRHFTSGPWGGKVEGAKVQVFDMNGVFKRGFGEYGGNEGQMWKPQEVAADAQGRVYVTESAWHTIYVYDSYGTDLASTYLGKIEDPSLTSPIGMAIGKSNRLFAVSLVARKIYAYRILEGTPAAYIVGTPASHDFGIAYVGGSSETRAFDIFNIGGGGLAIGMSTFTGSNPSEFTMQSDSCSDHIVAPSGSCVINAALTPLSSGQKSAILSIPNNDPDDDPFEISLSGLANIVPAAVHNGPFSITEGESIALDGSASTDPDGEIVLYEWDIDNNGVYDFSSPLPTWDYTYFQDGHFTIKLRVTDDLGATAAVTTTAIVADTGPTVDFTASPTYGSTPLTVNFTNKSAGYDQPLFYEWDFDGDDWPDSYEQNPIFVFDGAGSYTVSLKVTDSDGSNGTKVDYITVISPYTLTVNITGSGTVTSLPAGIDCGADCTEQYSEGTVVNLTAEPEEAGSTFAGWTGGDCSGTGWCNVTVNEDTEVTAAFDICPNLPVRISGTTVYYSTIQDAYEATEGGQTIQSQAVVLEADLNLERSITLDGGYNCEYTTETGMTRLNGTIAISNGTVTIGNFIIE